MIISALIGTAIATAVSTVTAASVPVISTGALAAGATTLAGGSALTGVGAAIAGGTVATGVTAGAISGATAIGSGSGVGTTVMAATGKAIGWGSGLKTAMDTTQVVSGISKMSRGMNYLKEATDSLTKAREGLSALKLGSDAVLSKTQIAKTVVSTMPEDEKKRLIRAAILGVELTAAKVVGDRKYAEGYEEGRQEGYQAACEEYEQERANVGYSDSVPYSEESNNNPEESVDYCTALEQMIAKLPEEELRKILGI